MKKFSVILEDSQWHKLLELRGKWMRKHCKDLSNTKTIQMLIEQTTELHVNEPNPTSDNR